MTRSLAHALATTALLMALHGAAPASILASCVMPIPIEEAVLKADSVFVGTVTAVANSNRWATVAIEEVWFGPDLAPVVEIRGGPGPGTATSVDRQFAPVTRYLFVLSIAEGALSDNACSPTTEWAPDLADLRPASAHPPIASEPDPDTVRPFDAGSILLPAALIVGAGIAVFGAALAVRRAR